MDRHLHLWEKAALIALSFTLLAACRAQGERAALREGTLRLHVIAASDETEEQAVKLRVRDAVLDYVNQKLIGVSDRTEAEERLFEDLNGVAHAAAEAACGRQVTVTLGPANYPTRYSESGSLPAGRYESLRVILGEGEGHNWWGLIFPQLALPAAQTEAVESMALLTEPRDCEIRFFVLEVWDWLVNRLR